MAKRRGAGLAPTHEPRIPSDGSFPQIEVFLTGEEVEECIGVRIHGRLHYLHSSSARALEKRLHLTLEDFNQKVRELRSTDPESAERNRVHEV